MNTVASLWPISGYASVLTAIKVNSPIGRTLSTLVTIAPRPADAAGIGRACNGVQKALQAVIEAIGTPGDRLLEFAAEVDALLVVVSNELRATGTQELPVPLRGRTGKGSVAIAESGRKKLRR